MSSTDRKENEEARRTQLTEFLCSGMTAKAWCAQNGMSPSTLYYWRKKQAADNAQGSKWVDIAQIAAQGIARPACTAIIPVTGGAATVHVGAFAITVERTTDTEALRKALGVAASLC